MCEVWVRVSGVNWEYWELFASLRWKIYGQTVLHHPVASNTDTHFVHRLSITYIKLFLLYYCCMVAE